MKNLPVSTVVKRRNVSIVLHPDALSPHADQRVRLLIELLPELLPSNPTVEELAERVQLTPKQLRLIFNRETGAPVKQYLKALQMEVAGSLLQHEGVTIRQAMARVGVVDFSHFMREFKRVYRMTPSEYRQAQRQHVGAMLWRPPATNYGPTQSC
jgi:AraC-like DNA-binding protein